MKKISKILFFLILGLLGLIFLLLIFTQTGWFRDILKDQVVGIANEQLNGSLAIDEINGDFFNDIEILGIRILQNDTTAVYVEKVSLDYNLSGIMFKSVNINFIEIDSVYIFLKQENDTTWNLSKLLKESEEPEVPDTAESEFDWNIGLGLFEILRSEIKISSKDTSSVIPEKLDNINFAASAELTPDFMRFVVNTFTLNSYKPNFELEDLDISTELTDELIGIENFILKTAQNRIDLNVQYFQDNSDVSTLTLSTDPIYFDEFKPFLPTLSVKGNPVLNIMGNYKNNSADINLSLIDEIQSILLTATAENLDANPGYILDLKIDSLQIGKWTADAGISSFINSVIRVKGRGTSFQTFDADAEILIAESSINEIDLDTLKINGKLKEDDLLFSISLDSEFGNFLGDFDLDGLEKERIYKIDLNGRKLDISPFTADQNLGSDINFMLSVNGEGFDPNTLSADLSFNLEESNVMDYSVSSIESRIRADEGVFKIDTFNIISDYADINISGILSPDKMNDVRFNFITKDISAIPQLKDLGEVSLKGEMIGSAKGTFKSLAGEVEISFDEIVYENYSVDNVYAVIDINKEGDMLEISADGDLSKIDLDGTTINNLSLDASFGESRLRSELAGDINDTSSIKILSEVVMDTLISVLIEEFDFEISDYRWKNLKDTMLVVIDDEKYSFTDFDLSNGEQSLSIEGYIDQNGTNDLSLEIEKLDVGNLVNTFKKDINIEAVLNSEIRIKGDLNKPEVKGNLGITDLNYNNELSGEMITDFSLIDEKIEYKMNAEFNENNLESDGSFTMKLSPDDSASVIPGDEPLNINLKIDIPTLAPFAKYIETVDKLDGSINSELAVSNSLNNLDLNGFFRIENSALQSEIYGIDFSDIDLNFEAENKNYFLRKFSIQGGEGDLSLEGEAEFAQGPLAGNPDKIKLDIEANEFEIAESRNLEAKIDGNLSFQDEAGNTKFSGDLSVLRSRVYLPYFTESASGKAVDESKPLLVKELEKSRITADTLNISDRGDGKDSLGINESMKNIIGRFRLNIPKNTWIVSPDMNIELSGEVDIVKEGDFFELYGNMQTIRGKLAILGKEFKIVKGQIIFDGGAEVNPGLNIQLDYIFRSSNKMKRSLELLLTGTAKSPKLDFKIDGSAIDEGNAISYLLFGKSLDEISQGQKSNVKNSNADLAKTIAGNLVAAQLKNTLGDALALDVVEIKGEDNWQQASLTAGKYLTNDLYVSYEQGFGNSETNEVNPSIVTLEYGLTEFLFFQLVEGNDKTAGFDFIFKFDF